MSCNSPLKTNCHSKCTANWIAQVTLMLDIKYIISSWGCGGFLSYQVVSSTHVLKYSSITSTLGSCVAMLVRQKAYTKWGKGKHRLACIYNNFQVCTFRAVGVGCSDPYDHAMPLSYPLKHSSDRGRDAFIYAVQSTQSKCGWHVGVSAFVRLFWLADGDKDDTNSPISSTSQLRVLGTFGLDELGWDSLNDGQPVLFSIWCAAGMNKRPISLVCSSLS